MPKNRIQRETRCEASDRVIQELRYGNVRHHVTLNGRGTPRYIIIDIEQNRRRINDCNNH